MAALPDLATFMAEIRKAGIKRTLRDHLTLQGFDADKNAWNSMKGKVVRALSTPGGYYTDMANTLICRSKSDRGDIAELLQEMDDQFDRPSFETSIATRETIAPMEAKDDWHFTGPGGTVEKLHTVEPRIAKASRPAQNDYLGALRQLVMERDIAMHGWSQESERRKRAERQVDELMLRLPPPNKAAA